jgi:hypothetical protein
LDYPSPAFTEINLCAVGADEARDVLPFRQLRRATRRVIHHCREHFRR